MLIHMDDIEWNPTDGPRALASLEAVTGRLREQGDARAVFCDIYLTITRRLVELIESPGAGGFLEPAWFSGLIGRFAAEVLIATRASLQGEPVSAPAWRFACHYPAARVTRPYQNAILGVSAHINHDLGQVVYQDLVARGVHRASLGRYRHDFDRVNQVLWTMIPACLELVVKRYECASTRRMLAPPLARPVIRGVIMAVLKLWRARVWAEVVELMDAAGPEARRAVVARMERRAGRIAQAVCAADVLWLWLRGETPPFRLSLAATAWPGVRSVSQRELAAEPARAPDAPEPLRASRAPAFAALEATA